MDKKAIARELIDIQNRMHLEAESPFIPSRAQLILRNWANTLRDIAQGMDEEVYNEWYNRTRHRNDYVKDTE